MPCRGHKEEINPMTPKSLEAWLLAGLLLFVFLSPSASFGQDLENWEGSLALDNLSIGRRLAQDGKYAEAIKRYDRAINTGKLDQLNLSIALNNRGNAHAALENNSRAIEDYNRALEVRPGFIEALYNRGIAYYQVGMYQKSIEDFSTVIQVNIGFASAYFNRSFPLARLGRYKEAIASLRQAISLNPSLKHYQTRLEDLQAAARQAGELPPAEPAAPPATGAPAKTPPVKSEPQPTAPQAEESAGKPRIQTPDAEAKPGSAMPLKTEPEAAGSQKQTPASEPQVESAPLLPDIETPAVKQPEKRSSPAQPEAQPKLTTSQPGEPSQAAQPFKLPASVTEGEE